MTDSKQTFIDIFDKKHNPVLLSCIYANAESQTWWSFPLHSHKNALEISLVLSGKGTFFCNNQPYSVKEGDIKIKQPGQVYSDYTDPDDPIEQMSLLISGIHLLDLPENHLMQDNYAPVLVSGTWFPLLQQLFLQIYHLNRRDEPVTRFVQNELLRTVVSTLMALLPEKRHLKTVSRKSKSLYGVIEYLNCHYTENITLEMLAQKFYISQFYLVRKFKEYTGMTINQYIVHLRVGEAKQLLIHTDLSIKEIALCCGYSNLQYFYATFRKHAMCTPLEFQKRYQS